MIRLGETFEESEQRRQGHFANGLAYLQALDAKVVISDSDILEHTNFASKILALLESCMRFSLRRLSEINSLEAERNRLYFQLTALKETQISKKAA